MPLPNGKQFKTCNKCGKEGLVWAQTKAGKYYLTDPDPMEIRGETGRVIKTVRPAHDCAQHLRQVADDKAWEEHQRQEKESREKASAPMSDADAWEILRKAGRVPDVPYNPEG